MTNMVKINSQVGGGGGSAQVEDRPCNNKGLK